MKNILLIALSIGGITSAFNAVAEEDLLTGDTRLACEAILCLSTGDRPSECTPSIRKFFSIHDKKPHKTIQKRKDFLALCPASKEKGMPEYGDLIANHAEKCSAERLNRDLKQQKRVQECKGRGDNETCKTVVYYRISDKMPNYCDSFVNHEYTDIKLKYQGENDWIRASEWEDSDHGKWMGY